MSLTIRKVRTSDARFVWRLRNEIGVRRESFNSKIVKWREHRIWFGQILKNAQSQIWIVRKKKTRIGQIRFDVGDGQSIVHIALTQKARGKGLGPRALRMAVARQFKNEEPCLYAFIRRNNIPSLRCFQKAGFGAMKKLQIHGIPCYRVQYFTEEKKL